MNKALKVKYKAFFIIFKVASVDKSCLRSYSVPFFILHLVSETIIDAR